MRSLLIQALVTTSLAAADVALAGVPPSLLHSFGVVCTSNTSPKGGCLAVLIANHYVLTPNHCVQSQLGGEPTTVDFALALTQDTRRNSSTRLSGSSISWESIEVRGVGPHQQYLASGSELYATNDWVVLKLDRDQEDTGDAPDTLYLLDEDAATMVKVASRGGFSVLMVNRETIQVAEFNDVTFDDLAACGLASEDSEPKLTSATGDVVCVTNLVSEDSDVGGLDNSQFWSVLLFTSHDEDGDGGSKQYFAGFGSSHDDSSGTRSFTWVESAGPEFVGKPLIDTHVNWKMLPSYSDTVTVPELSKDLQFLVGLRKTRKGADFCGGSLISPRIVMTAAHCVEQFVDSVSRGPFYWVTSAPGVPLIWVSIGSLSTQGAWHGEQIPVTAIALHPEYNNVTRANNVAVLELAFQTAPPYVKLYNSQPVPQTGRIFGFKQFGDGTRNEVLDLVDVAVMDSNDQCADQLGDRVGSTSFCALNRGPRARCESDQGGPLYTTDDGGQVALLGMAGSGAYCMPNSIPNTYANVSETEDFLRELRLYVTWTTISTEAPTPTLNPDDGPHVNLNFSIASLAVLGSPEFPRACIAAAVAPKFVAAPAHCVAQFKPPIQWAEFGFTLEDEATTGELTAPERINVIAITFDPGFNGSALTTEPPESAVGHDWAVLELEHARKEPHTLFFLDDSTDIILNHFSGKQRAHVLSVDTDTLYVTWTSGVVPHNAMECGLEAQLHREFICTYTEPSFIPIRTKTWEVLTFWNPPQIGRFDERYYLAGFQSFHADRTNTRSFTWVEATGPEFLGKPLIQDATWSEMPLETLIGKDVPALESNMRFITGVRVGRKDRNYCGGSLITPTIVLTAAHCIDDTSDLP